MRWPGLLEQMLGPRMRVIEEGMNGRTTDCDDPTNAFRNGRAYFGACLESHKPIHLVTLMLGKNDTKKMFRRSEERIAQAMAGLMGLARASGAGVSGDAPRMLLIAPPGIGKLDGYKEHFEDAAPKAAMLPKLYRDLASQFGCDFLDASEIVRPSDADGIHLDAAAHRTLADAAAQVIGTRFAET